MTEDDRNPVPDDDRVGPSDDDASPPRVLDPADEAALRNDLTVELAEFEREG